MPASDAAGRDPCAPSRTCARSVMSKQSSRDAADRRYSRLLALRIEFSASSTRDTAPRAFRHPEHRVLRTQKRFPDPGVEPVASASAQEGPFLPGEPSCQENRCKGGVAPRPARSTLASDGVPRAAPGSPGASDTRGLRSSLETCGGMSQVATRKVSDASRTRFRTVGGPAGRPVVSGHRQRDAPCIRSRRVASGLDRLRGQFRFEHRLGRRHRHQHGGGVAHRGGGSLPSVLAITPDGTNAYVANESSNNVLGHRHRHQHGR